MVIELIQRLIRLPYLCTEIASQVGFEILKESLIAAQYSAYCIWIVYKFQITQLTLAIDFTKNAETGVFNRGLPKGEQFCILTLTDEDFTRLTYHKFTLEQVKNEINLEQISNAIFDRESK